MQVFKSYLMTLRGFWPSSIVSFALFFILMMMMTFMNQPTTASDFQKEKVDLLVIDEDNSYASQELVNYVSANHNIVDMGTSDDEIRNAMFYRTIEYVLTIKDGYGDKLVSGNLENIIENVKLPGTYAAVYLDNQLEQYIKQISVYIAAGYTVEDAAVATNEVLSEKIEATVFKPETTEAQSEYSVNGFYFMQFLPYIFLLLTLSVLMPSIVCLLSRRHRIFCAPYSSSKFTLQLVLGIGTVSLAIWLIFMVIGAIITGEDFFSERGLMLLLNNFIMYITTVSITLLVSAIASPPANLVNENNGSTMQLSSIASNVIGLSTSFLCGVFVPQSLLGESVLMVGRFWPAYWYIKALNIVVEREGEFFNIGDYGMCLLVQLGFTFLFVTIAMFIFKKRSRL